MKRFQSVVAIHGLVRIEAGRGRGKIIKPEEGGNSNYKNEPNPSFFHITKYLLLATLLDSGFEEGKEEGVRSEGAGLELGMKLSSKEERVVREFKNFHQILVGIDAGEDEAGGGKLVAIVIIEFVAVAVAFGDSVGFVGAVGESVFSEGAGVAAQTHRSAIVFVFYISSLFGKNVNNRMGSVGIDFGGVSVFESDNVAGEFHGGHLHTITKSQEGDVIPADVFNSFYFSFNAARTETAGNNDAVIGFKLFQRYRIFLKRFRVEPVNNGAAFKGIAGVFDGLNDGNVSVG